MKRYSLYLITLCLLITIWGILKFNENLLPSIFGWYLNVFPFHLLIILGCYCLGKLGLDLLLFNDYPLEIKALEEDIKIAKDDLQKRGFKRI